MKTKLTFIDLLKGYSILVFALVLIAPKIYIKNEIYYKSRSIEKLNLTYEVLESQNKALKQKVEKINFKRSVLDSLEIKNENVNNE